MKHQKCPIAVARIYGGMSYPELRGTVKFFTSCEGVIIEAEIFGLPKTETGFFAFHIHEGGACLCRDFSEVGGHLNLGEQLHPDHAGDLPPLLSAHGKAYFKVFTDRFRIEDVVGRTVIIHNSPDDFHTQSSGNSGSKIACGVIQRGQNVTDRCRKSV